MANWGANHGVTVYGHVGADLITLASMLRIPVALHNVPQEKVYRPHAWAAFGTKDTEAADFRRLQALRAPVSITTELLSKSGCRHSTRQPLLRALQGVMVYLK